METWKQVKNYEGIYEVSSYGRVRSVDRYVNSAIRHNTSVFREGKMLKQNKKRNGYLTVDLCKNGTVKTITVHKIVAEAFLEKEDGKTEVNHINCNKADNRVKNLEWCTPKENKDHAKANNLYRGPGKKPLICLQTNQVFESSYAAAEWVNNKKFGNSKQIKGMSSKIRACCLGQQSIAYGYTWKYLDRIEGSSTIP